MFVFYAGWYVLLSLAMTVLSVPYLALQPEMALGYDARTSLNTYRNVGSVLGVFAAIAFRPVAQALGGGTAGFAAAGVVYGLVLVVPWLAVYAATWERPDFQTRETRVSLVAGLRILAGIRSFRRLTGMYFCGRISMDLIGAMLVIYFTHWIGRSEDFEPAMFLFLTALMCSLPIWLRIARHFDKSTIFIVGSAWWMASQAFVFLAQPHWPPWVLFAFMPLVGIGYAMVDLMPWAMLGEVVDEDDLATGERREGLFYGVFMFLRKLGGTLAVAAALWLLGATGFTKGQAQTEQAILTIRLLSSVVPAAFLAVSIAFAWRYPLTRQRHAQIRAQLDARNGTR
jgi:Na+/melibiose symporter-like transporter